MRFSVRKAVNLETQQPEPFNPIDNPVKGRKSVWCWKNLNKKEHKDCSLFAAKVTVKKMREILNEIEIKLELVFLAGSATAFL